MSFFTMSQNEKIFSSTNILQKKDKMSYRTDEPYVKSSQNGASMGFTQPRIFSPAKINPNFFPTGQKENNFMKKCDRLSEVEGNSNHVTLRNNFSTSSMFPNNKSMAFQPIVKPKNNCSFIQGDNDAFDRNNMSLRPRTLNMEFNYDETKMKLAEYLGNEFANFKNGIKNTDLGKKQEFDETFRSFVISVPCSLYTIINLCKDSMFEAKIDTSL